MNHIELKHLATKALRDRNLNEVYSLTDQMINSELPQNWYSGYILRGTAFEIGNDLYSIDLQKAYECYCYASKLYPSAALYVDMARTLIKQGSNYFPLAKENLMKASALENMPEIDLAYTTIYKDTSPPNYVLAQNHYLKAALAGRLRGFYGYALTSRKLGQHIRALITDLIRIFIGPFLFLFQGKKANKGF